MDETTAVSQKQHTGPDRCQGQPGSTKTRTRSTCKCTRNKAYNHEAESGPSYLLTWRVTQAVAAHPADHFLELGRFSYASNRQQLDLTEILSNDSLRRPLRFTARCASAVSLLAFNAP